MAALLAVYVCVPVGRASEVVYANIGITRDFYYSSLFVDSAYASDSSDSSNSLGVTAVGSSVDSSLDDSESGIAVASLSEAGVLAIYSAYLNICVSAGAMSSSTASSKYTNMYNALYGADSEAEYLILSVLNQAFSGQIYYDWSQSYQYSIWDLLIALGFNTQSVPYTNMSYSYDSDGLYVTVTVGSLSYTHTLAYGPAFGVGMWAAYAVRYLSQIYSLNSTMSSRLYSNSGSVAYWCYKLYSEGVSVDLDSVTVDVSDVVEALTYSSSNTTNVAYYLRYLYYYYASMSYSVSSYGYIYYLSSTSSDTISTYSGTTPYGRLQYALSTISRNTAYTGYYLYTLVNDGLDVELDVSDIVDALTYSSSDTTTVAYYARNLWYYYVSMSYSTSTYGSIYYLTSSGSTTTYTYTGTTFYGRLQYALSAISRNTAYAAVNLYYLQDVFDFSTSDWSDYYTDFMGWCDYVYSTLNSSNSYLSTISSRLYYNSYSVAYWAYMAYYKLNTIDTDTGNIYSRLAYTSSSTTYTAAQLLYYIYSDVNTYLPSAATYLSTIASYAGSNNGYLSSIASYSATMSGYLSSIYTYTSNTASRLSTANGYLSTIATNSTSMVTYLSNIATYTSNAASYLSSISGYLDGVEGYLSSVVSNTSVLSDILDALDISDIVDALTYSSSDTTTVAYYARNLWYYYVSMSYSTSTYGSIYYLTSSGSTTTYTYTGTTFYGRLQYALSAISRNTAYAAVNLYNLQDVFDFSTSDWSDYYTDFMGWCDYVYSTLNSSNSYLSTISSRLQYNSNSVAYWVYSAYSKLSTIDTDTGNIADRLTYNSGSAAYWLYLIYDALADASSSLTALDRLTSIYTELSNLNETVEGLNLDITVDVSSSFADTLASALPDALSLTTLTVDFSGLADALVGIDFNIGNLADIDIDTASIVDALEELLAYGSYDAAQLLYLCWGELQGLDLEVPEVDLSDVLDVLGDILDALTYTVEGSSAVAAAALDGVAAAASTSTTYTNAQLIYMMLQAWQDFDEVLDGIDSDLSDILQELVAEENSDLLEALSSLAESLVSSSLLASVVASTAEKLASVLLPLVVLNLTLDLFIGLASVEAVEPEFDYQLPIGDGSYFSDSFDLSFIASLLPVFRAGILIIYAIGLASVFKDWVYNLKGD